ncbi:MAG: ABC transporter permease [Candidatus Zixiibacteriota bacterium]|nr:MAG: ABC transporter permease [candidate division Zixibacteria bacterium]
MKLITYKFILFLKLILREFRAQKLRMSLTVAAIAWGTVSITLLMAFTVGLEQQMRKARSGLGARIMILWGGQTSKVYQGLPPGRRIHLHPEDVDLLKNRIPEIEQISEEYLRWGVTLDYNGKQVNKLVSGVAPEFKDMRSHYAQMGGRFINKIDYDEKKRVMFLGTRVADELFGEEDPVGKRILVNNIPFTVIGVMVDKMQNSNYHGPDENYTIIPATTFVAIFGDPWLDNIVFSMKEGVDSDLVEQELFRVMGGKYRFDPTDSPALWTWDLVKDSEITRKVFLGIEIFMWFIGGMTLLIAGVGVANIMYVAVRERTREIGTKIALGAKRKHIIWQFLTEALSIAFVGGSVGISFSLLVCSLLSALPMEGALELMSKPTVNMPVAFITVVTLAVIGLFAGLFPARKAASVNPVEALRYE